MTTGIRKALSNLNRLRICRPTAVLLTIIFFQCASSAAEGPSLEQVPPQPLSIQEAVTYGLAHNPLLKAADEELKAAEQGVHAARAGFLPRLDASYGYTRWNDEPIAKFHLPGQQPLEVQTSDTNVNHWQADLIQPLFRGFGLTAQYGMAKEERAIARDQKSMTRLDLLRDIRSLFIQALLAQRVLDVANESVAQFEAHLKDARAFFRQGLVPRNDVLKSEVALANARQNETSAARHLVITRARLNRLLGIEERMEIELAEWDKTPAPDEQATPLPDLPTLQGQALKARPELSAISASIQQASEGAQLAFSNAYPHVSLFGTYYREGSDLAASENDFTNESNAAVGVRVNWNLFEGGRTRAEVSRWRHKRTALKKKEQDLFKQIRLEVEDAYSQLQVAKMNLATAREAVQQAKENLRITEVQYRQQVVNSTEVIDAQFFLSQARINYYKALYGYQLAWVDLERAVGKRL